MSLKKLFVIVLGVTVGSVLSVVLLFGVWWLWHDRTQNRDSSTVLAKYLGLAMIFPDNDAAVLVPEVALANHSGKDLNLSSSSMRIFVRTRDGTIREADRAANFPKELVLPAGEGTAVKFPLVLNAAIDDGCERPTNTDPEGPEFQKFLDRCVNKIVGVTILIDSPQLMKVGFSLDGEQGLQARPATSK